MKAYGGVCVYYYSKEQVNMCTPVLQVTALKLISSFVHFFSAFLLWCNEEIRTYVVLAQFNSLTFARRVSYF
jgi:hypothetical protein